ncbi:sensor domain-containing diguanylate cyclase [Paenibacillus sp. PL91]|uniref:sensor domain-containing diguanylate cyclase n=1 Tax=Paenibacillus sp. PL91 TaxID=2729538 RepID=UPI00145C6B03|nr:sensor domain-containing diguanylate cyclase [Paenibacillus sp. PL91]MBC9204923.1 sensor domain-containing diguanylate cyclase [Paenibacillus sp. PL91]
MSSPTRSLEDAADHIIDNLKHFLQADTLIVMEIDDTGSRIIRAFDRHENTIQDNPLLPLLKCYSSLVLKQSAHLLSIPNILDDQRTASLPFAKQLGALSFVGIPVKTADQQLYGAICAIHSKPLLLDERQLGFLESMAVFLGYILDLENASVTDSLTGLYNRRYLSDLYQSCSDKQFSVIFIDIDDFKEVNDSFGHDFGDLLLLQIAARLKQSVRKTDILVRYGGDEFLICFQHLVDNHDIDIVAGKIKESIKEPFIINGKTIHISASIGISATHGTGTSLKNLISDADLAMYGIKQNEKTFEKPLPARK